MADEQAAAAPAPTASKTRTILVVGATGKQGRAFIDSALSSSTDVRILALTRNAAAPAAKALVSAASASTSASASKDGGEGGASRVTVVQADLDKPDSVRKVFEDAKAAKGEHEEGANGVWGVFLVLAFPGLGADASGEEKQGKLVADLAKEYAVAHLVFSSVERGGEGHDHLLLQDRAAKVAVETHIKALAAESDGADGALRWSFVRPGFFMENFDGTIGSITTTVLRTGLKKDTKLQMIAAEDIGHVAFALFQDSEANASRAVVVIGDVLTTQEMADAYARGAGKPLNAVPNFVGKALLAINKHTKDLISDIERVYTMRSAADLPEPERYDSLIAQCRALYPGMQTFETWARTRGTKKERTKKWNNVSVGEVVLGKR